MSLTFIPLKINKNNNIEHCPSFSGDIKYWNITHYRKNLFVVINLEWFKDNI